MGQFNASSFIPFSSISCTCFDTQLLNEVLRTPDEGAEDVSFGCVG